jgi:cytochrome c-type biogenesis protein CcmH
MKLFLSLLVITALSLINPAEVMAGPIDTFEFKDEVTQKRFSTLSKELRCPKCQNQNLADSNSPIAQDLRKEVYDMLMAGKSDQEIVDFMVYRYGDFVRYKPEVNQLTYVLWYGPVAFIGIGLIALFLLIRSRKADNQSAELSAEQQAKLEKLLKE